MARRVHIDGDSATAPSRAVPQPPRATGQGEAPASMDIGGAASMSIGDVLSTLSATADGLTSVEAARRLRVHGHNSVDGHRTRLLPVIASQLRSPLLILLLVAAAVSFLVGERTDAVIIGVIVSLSVGLGVSNEYRAERAADLLHDQVRRQATVLRDGTPVRVDVVDIVPGDVVLLRLGDVVPADIRIVEQAGLACDESVLTGESLPVEKSPRQVPAGCAVGDLASCALMGTVVAGGTARGVVVATGARSEFGQVAAGLATRRTETEFQIGLRRFAMLLVWVAASLCAAILVINVVLRRPLLDSVLFALAIAVGITPQLLPAVVATSLAAGSRRLAARKVLVKRLVCIEDLGNVDTLFTDKTGTLTIGRITFMRAVGVNGVRSADVLRLGLLACDTAIAGRSGAVDANPLDAATVRSPSAEALLDEVGRYQRVAVLPFDHDRAMTSVLVRDPDSGEQILVVKGAPEAVRARTADDFDAITDALTAELDAGHRVVAVASRTAPTLTTLTADDERELTLAGLLVYLDPPKPDAAEALTRLADLGVRVRVLTGDHPTVAAKVCRDLGLPDGSVLTGTDIDRLDDHGLATAIDTTTVFARVTPAQKARIVRVRRQAGGDVAFLGDGVNDALALHAADVGISVDSATDVAKDAADVILLEKDLGVLADGVVEGRRIFANTIKYVLMGTSSNFGNMFSAAGASALLPFLPMLPDQILLGNLLYDTSQLAIPTDDVDHEQLRRPSHWDIQFIRRFMLFFGPVSSVFDFATFGIMRWGFHAGPELFRSGWFIESLATQTLVIFVIRTRRVPFFRSRPSLPLTLAALGVVTVGVLLPLSPLAGVLGFAAPPGAFFVVIIGLVLAYLALAQAGTWLFYRLGTVHGRPPVRQRRMRRLRRRMAHFHPSGRSHHLTPRLPWRLRTARPGKVGTLAPSPSRSVGER
ncbi:MAG TPA: magnesium-translocating P-type ATPase [Micromonosporaceae bacterium]|nr:magnesium-translocating P-type ATPase [Micromonosporaceae bacterium]